MKGRNREVNIFNMSLLDILCGALGAFCFMMLVLFPYYKPSHLSAEDRQSYQNAQQMQQKLQQLEAEMQQQGSRPTQQLMQQAQQALGQARQQLAQTQQQLDRTRANMEQAQQKASQAQATANKESAKLAMKHPLVVQEWWTAPGATVGLFIHDPAKGVDGKTAPPFDPADKHQAYFFSNTTWLIGPGSQSWVVGDVVPGKYGVYYRLDKPATPEGPVAVIGGFDIESHFAQIPNVTLSASRPYAKVGDIVIDEKFNAVFEPASGPTTPPGGPPSGNR